MDVRARKDRLKELSIREGRRCRETRVVERGKEGRRGEGGMYETVVVRLENDETVYLLSGVADCETRGRGWWWWW